MTSKPISLDDAWDLLGSLTQTGTMEHRLIEAGANRPELDAWCATIATRTTWTGRPVPNRRYAHLAALQSYLFSLAQVDHLLNLTLTDAIAWCCALIPDPILGDCATHERRVRAEIATRIQSYDDITDGPAYLAAGLTPAEAPGTDPATARALAALRGVTLPPHHPAAA